MATTHLDKPVKVHDKIDSKEYIRALDSFDIQTASNIVWKEITEIDQMIQEKAPFKLIKTDKEGGLKVIIELCERLYSVGVLLTPILPQTSETIKILVRENKMPEAPLFLRKE